MKLWFLLALTCTLCIVHWTTAFRMIRQRCDGKRDIVFLLDTSGSVGRRHFNVMLNFVKSISSNFVIGRYRTQVGVDVFSTRAYTRIRLKDHNNINSLKSAVSRIRYTGGLTNTYLGLNNLVQRSFKRYNGHRYGVPKIAIVMTDGRSQNKAKTLNAAKIACLHRIQIIAIGIGNKIDFNEVKGMECSGRIGRRRKRAIWASTFRRLSTTRFQNTVSKKACNVHYIAKERFG